MLKLKKLLKNNFTIPTLIGVGILIVSIVIIVFTSWILYNRTSQILDTNLRERLLSIVTTASTEFDSNDLQQLQVEEDWKKPEWAKVVHQMEKIRKNNSNILFVYMFRKNTEDPTQMEFVADSHSIDPYAKIDLNNDGVIDDADQLQWPGQPYDVSEIPETFDAYNGPTTTKDIYSDQWGPVLTGYAPIKDENGNVVAILAVDIKAGDFAIITKQTLYPFLIFIAFLSVTISVLIFIILYSWKRFSKSLQSLLIQRENLVHLVTHKVKGSFTRSKYIFAGMLDGTFGDINPEIKKRAEQGLESDNMGIETVDLVLSVANMQKGIVKYDMKEIDLKTLVEKTINEKSMSAEAKGLKIETEMKDAEYKILGDSFWLKEVVNNLIENSIKYSRTGSIVVKMENTNHQVLLSVKDTGIGISDEDKKNLFTEGGRGKDSVKINVDSTGYGLYSVKLIVEAHKGRVWAESEGPEKGSTFFVELPLI